MDNHPAGKVMKNRKIILVGMIVDENTLSALHTWLEQFLACKAETCRAVETSLPDVQYKQR